MYDHVTLRVSDLVAGTSLFATVLDQLEIEQTARTPSFSVWGNFALTAADEDHPIAQHVHVAFIAPSPDHVDRFWQAGVAAGFADDGAAGPVGSTPTTTTRPSSKTPTETASTLSTATVNDPGETSITLRSAPPMSRRRPRSTRRSAMQPASRSGASRPTRNLRRR